MPFTQWDLYNEISIPGRHEYLSSKDSSKIGETSALSMSAVYPFTEKILGEPELNQWKMM